MPRKTIYIRDEDLPIFEKAQKELDAPIGTIVIGALRNALKEKENLWHKTFCLQMLRKTDSLILNELIDHMLKDIPVEMVLATGHLATLAARYDPGLYDGVFTEYHPYIAIEHGNGFNDEYFDLGLAAARKGEEMLEEARKAWETVAERNDEFPPYPKQGIAGVDELEKLPPEILEMLLDQNHTGLFMLLLDQDYLPESVRFLVRSRSTSKEED